MQLHSYFIPVTTRTIEQFQRITLFQNEIIPEYAITSNGGNILHNGKQDVTWNKEIKKNFSRMYREERYTKGI